jgi:hypothetical protein
MKMQKIFIAIAFILLFASMLNFTKAEISVQGFNEVVDNNATRQTMIIILDDTSLNSVAKQKNVNLTIYANHYLNNTILNPELNPISISFCLYTSTHTKNTYDADGNLLNTTIEITTQEYNTSATSLLYEQIMEKDILQLDLVCYWNNTIDNLIFQHIGTFYQMIGLSLKSPSFACEGCGRQDYEEIMTEYLSAQRTSENYMKVFNDFTNFTTSIVEVWLMAYWIIRIFLLLLLVGFIFAVGLWLYHFIKNIIGRM